MKPYQPKDPAHVHIAIFLLSAVVFFVDAITPLGIAVWIFYLTPMAASLFAWRPTLPLLIAATQTLLATVGFFLSPPGIDPQIATVNRLLGLITIWIVAWMAWFLITAKLTVRREQWLKTGESHVNVSIAGEQDLEQLSNRVLLTLADYLGARAGAIFIQDNGVFRRSADYALTNVPGVPERVESGEGIVGQCARDGRLRVVSDLPDNYFQISSSLGGSRPRHLVVAPALVDGAANAVIELAFFRPVDDAVTDLLTRISGVVALNIRSRLYRARLEQLLEETQRQTEELQAQSEELRSSNDELETQSRALSDSQQRLERQQSQLEQTNAHLEEQTQLLEAQKDELTRASKGLIAQAEELEQASRYKSDFLASMSHELRTPLNSALILARLLSENRSGNLTPQQVEYARNIEASGSSLLNLINDVLDLSKVEAGRLDITPQPVPLTRLAENLRAIFTPLAEQKKLSLRIRIADDAPPTIETDQQRLEQVLKNLLSNAIKFTDQGEVSLDMAPAPNERLRFSVHDTGSGIPSHLQEFIFEPFRQADSSLNRKFGGTGLGLSISRELVHLLGGEIRLTSDVGLGSTFEVFLPVNFEGAENTVLATKHPLSASPEPRFSHGGATFARMEDDRQSLTSDTRVILVVEDDEVFAYILRDLAHEMKFQCLIASSAAEAIVLSAQYTPSAIVLDVGLPDNSGLSLLDRLKHDVRTRHIPVHVVSAHDYTETALSLGAIGYVLKPVRREQLVDAFYRLENRLEQKLRRVLIVEDDPTQRESLRSLLGSRDVETVGVSTAAECLDQLRTRSFDCMVLDLTLPDASGFSLLETISVEDRYSFPPVIVYTGHELTPDEEQNLRRYSKSIIIKSAKSPERLLDEVTLFLHQVISDLPPEQQRMLETARSRDAVLEGRRILLVEDDVRNIFALTGLLEPRGVSLQIARNGLEALQALSVTNGNAPPCDLVLMDIMMPEMDGLTAMREIRKRSEWNRLPIIALTAKAMKNDQEQAIAAGANDFMAKPLDVEQFLSMVRVWMPR